MAVIETQVTHRMLNLLPVLAVCMYRDITLMPDSYLSSDIDSKQVEDTLNAGFRWVGVVGNETAVFVHFDTHHKQAFRYQIVHPLNPAIRSLGREGYSFVFALDSGMMVLEQQVDYD